MSLAEAIHKYRLPNLRSTAFWLEFACGAVALASLAQILQMRFGRDQGIYAMVASAILDGGMPYRDAWDFKPPGIYLVYALAQAVFGPNQLGIRIVEVLSLATLWPAFHWISGKLFGDVRYGSLAAALAILLEAELEFWHSGQPETFGGVLTVWALAFLVELTFPAEGSKPRAVVRIGESAAAGLLFGTAALMKPHLGCGVFVALVYLVVRSRRLSLPRSRLVVEGSTMLVAAMLPVLGVALWFGVRSALQDLIHTLFVFAPGYVATTFRARELPSLLYNAVVGTACGFSALVPLGIVLGILEPRQQSVDIRLGLATVGALAIPQVIGIALQAKFFPYHHAALLPLCALLAAPGLVRAAERLSRRWSWIGKAFLLAATLVLLDAAGASRDLPDSFLTRSFQRTRALLTPGRGEWERLNARLYSVADVSYGANMDVARWLATHTAKEDYVYLWGFEPFVYYAAQRSPGSRFIYNVPQRSAWSMHWARPALIRDLESTKPSIIGVLRHDVFPMVTGSALDSRSSLEEFPELKEFLDSKYELATTVDDFDLYRLRASDGRGETSLRW